MLSGPQTSLKDIFPELTAKQFICFEMYSTGSCIKQIAHHNEVAERTVERHLQSAKEAFGCISLSELRPIFGNRLLRLYLEKIMS